MAKEIHQSFRVTVTYSVSVKVTGATEEERRKAAESLAGYRLTKKIGCKLISANAVPEEV